MKRLLGSMLVGFISLMGVSAMAAEDAVYAFKVKVGGQEAVKKDPAAIFAIVEKPVAANADIEVEAQGQVLVNIVKCDEKGTPAPGAATAILMFSAPKGTLDKTMDGKKLEAGKYLTNVVAGNATSRVVFDIQ